ncbi:MAG: hypothetical protein ACKPFF_02730 [Planktothrix sp.]
MEIVYVRAIIQSLRSGKSTDALVVAIYLLALMEGTDISMNDMETVGKILEKLVDEGLNT